MSAVQDTSRRRLVRWLGLVAGALLIVALFLSFMDGRDEARDPRLGTPVMSLTSTHRIHRYINTIDRQHPSFVPSAVE
jgi:hypothetical protein